MEALLQGTTVPAEGQRVAASRVTEASWWVIIRSGVALLRRFAGAASRKVSLVMVVLLYGVRFLLELAALAGLAAGAWTLGGVLGALAAGAAVSLGVVVWGRWMAPKSAHRLRDPARFLAETSFFVVSAVASACAWGVGSAVVFGALAILVAVAVRFVPSPFDEHG